MKIRLQSISLVFTGLIFLYGCQPGSPGNDHQSTKPNILFLFADDQRAGTIGELGNNEIHTPNLDKLVTRGVSYTNTYIMGGSSAAVCSPSRAMMLTGRHLYGIEKSGWGSPVSKETETLPETLRKAGYQTFGTGKNHNGREVFARGFSDGDEIFFGGMSDHWNVPVYHFDSTGKYDGSVPYIKDAGSGKKISYKTNCDHVLQGKHSSELFADATIDFIRHRDRSRPFFAYVSFMAPHDPRSMPKEYEEQYDTASLEVPLNFLGQHPWDFGEFRIRDEVLAGFPRTPSEVKVHLRDYYAMISHLDAQIGRIIEALIKSGEYENTLVIFSADNGLAVGQHGLMGKQNLYEHSIGIPMVITGPGIPQNERRATLCYLYDLFPTLCELLEIEAPKTVQGSSYASTLNDDDWAHRQSMVFGYKESIRAYRLGDYKLIEYDVKGERHSQLFDLKMDPFEKTNLLEKEDQSLTYLELKKEMLKEMRVLGDTNQIFKTLVSE